MVVNGDESGVSCCVEKSEDDTGATETKVRGSHGTRERAAGAGGHPSTSAEEAPDGRVCQAEGSGAGGGRGLEQGSGREQSSRDPSSEADAGDQSSCAGCPTEGSGHARSVSRSCVVVEVG